MRVIDRFATLLLAAAFIIASSATINAQEFTQFRGLGGKGVAKGQLSDTFSLESNLVWKMKIEGAGWSQPIVANDRIFLTTAVAANGFKPKDFAGGVRMPESRGGGGKKPDFEVEWRVVCLDQESGKELWSTAIEKKTPKFAVHPSNSYATETPAVDKDGVYAYFGAIGMVVGLDFEGNLKWKQDVGAFKTGNDFGTGSSLAIHESKVFVQNFNEDSSKLFCFDTTSGKQLWANAREGQGTSWSTPVIWKNKQRTELVVSGGMTVDSFNPEDGSTLWTVSKVKAATACSICVDDEKIYFGGSDPMSKGPVFAVGPGGSGSIEPKRTNQTFESCVWRRPRSGPGMSTPVSNGKYLYIPDRSVLRCLDATSGELVYEKRLNGLSTIVACPAVIGDSLVLIDEKGTIGIVKVGNEFEMRIAGKLEDTVWSSPGVGTDSLLIRGVNQLYRLKF